MYVSTGEGTELLQPEHSHVLHSQLSALGVQWCSRAQHHMSDTALETGIRVSARFDIKPSVHIVHHRYCTTENHQHSLLGVISEHWMKPGPIDNSAAGITGMISGDGVH